MTTRHLDINATQQEHIDWVLEQQPYAGGFHHALIEAWRRADGENKARIEKAFPYDYRIPIGHPKDVVKRYVMSNQEYSEYVREVSAYISQGEMEYTFYFDNGVVTLSLPAPQTAGTITQARAYADMKAEELVNSIRK